MNGETDPTQLIRSLDQIDFIRIILILAGAWLLTGFIERVVPKLAERLPGRMRLVLLPSVPVIRLAILFSTILLVIPQVINPTFESLVALLGAAGLAIGFAFRDYLSSLIAGIVTIYERPYRPGDWISIDGTYGEVRSVGMRALRMVTPDDTVVIIPHQNLWTASIHNANDGQRDLMCVTEFYLRPDHDAGLARQRLREVALTSPYLNLDRPVTVVLAEKPWGTQYRLKAYPMDSRDQFQFMSDLTVRGKQALHEIGAQAVLLPAIPDKRV